MLLDKAKNTPIGACFIFKKSFNFFIFLLDEFFLLVYHIISYKRLQLTCFREKIYWGQGEEHEEKFFVDSSHLSWFCIYFVQQRRWTNNSQDCQ